MRDSLCLALRAASDATEALAWVWAGLAEHRIRLPKLPVRRHGHAGGDSVSFWSWTSLCFEEAFRVYIIVALYSDELDIDSNNMPRVRALRRTTAQVMAAVQELQFGWFADSGKFVGWTNAAKVAMRLGLCIESFEGAIDIVPLLTFEWVGLAGQGRA